MTVAQLIKELADAPRGSTVRLVMETEQVEGELFHEAKVVWWDDARDVTFIGDTP